MIIGYFFENVSEPQIVLETGDSTLSAIGGAHPYGQASFSKSHYIEL